MGTVLQETDFLFFSGLRIIPMGLEDAGFSPEDLEDEVIKEKEELRIGS